MSEPLEKNQFNMVEAISDDEQAFDQACAFENRVGSHGTYCHNGVVGARKCTYRWTSAKWHSECEGYQANPAYTGQWEGVDKPSQTDDGTWKRISSIGLKKD